jgi:hypothetical protein
MTWIAALSMATFIRADSTVVGITISLVLGGLLVVRMFTRELATAPPQLFIRSLDVSIALLFVLFALIIWERFHVLG